MTMSYIPLLKKKPEKKTIKGTNTLLHCFNQYEDSHSLKNKDNHKLICNCLYEAKNGIDLFT